MAEMLDATSSSELVTWFAFLRMEDEREREQTAGGISLAFGGDE